MSAILAGRTIATRQAFEARVFLKTSGRKDVADGGRPTTVQRPRVKDAPFRRECRRTTLAINSIVLLSDGVTGPRSW
jgi:hypothetical protein